MVATPLTVSFQVHPQASQVTGGDTIFFNSVECQSMGLGSWIINSMYVANSQSWSAVEEKSTLWIHTPLVGTE